tara:strand:- start:153 stop:389 length:237 start_codon:yes stop_codon:yes gene_type:complete
MASTASVLIWQQSSGHIFKQLLVALTHSLLDSYSIAGVQPHQVIKHFDILEDHMLRFSPRFEVFMVNQFRLQSMEEAF